MTTIYELTINDDDDARRIARMIDELQTQLLVLIVALDEYRETAQ